MFRAILSIEGEKVENKLPVEEIVIEKEVTEYRIERPYTGDDEFELLNLSYTCPQHPFEHQALKASIRIYVIT